MGYSIYIVYQGPSLINHGSDILYQGSTKYNIVMIYQGPTLVYLSPDLVLSGSQFSLS